jgi:hypothetical protein
VAGEHQLLDLAQALVTPGRLAGGLDGWQQERHQDADDRNDHQQLYEGKPSPRTNSRKHLEPPSKKIKKDEKEYRPHRRGACGSSIACRTRSFGA